MTEIKARLAPKDNTKRRAVLPNKKHEFSTGCRAAHNSWLHIKLGRGNGRAGGLPFSAARRTAFLCTPPALPSVLCAAHQPSEVHFSFGNTALQPCN